MEVRAFRDPDEETIAAQYANVPLENLEAAYEEAKFTFAEQAKRIDAVTSRATWLVATAAGVALAAVSQAKNIAELQPDPAWAWGLISGVLLAIIAAGLGFLAAGL